MKRIAVSSSLAFVTCAGLVALACSDIQPVSPAETLSNLNLQVAPALVEDGCTTLNVDLAGPHRSVFAMVDEPECGPIVPVVLSTTYERATQLLLVQVVLENRGSVTLASPARLLAWEDSLWATNPPGLSRNRQTRTYLELLEADSTGVDGAAKAWGYDETFLSRGTSRVLPAHTQSSSRWIKIRVHPGVSALRLRLRASAQRATPPVPSQAPDTVPSAIYEGPGAVLFDTLHFPLSDMVLRGVVSVVFKRDASQALRQNAVDLIGGEVIGGHSIPNAEGYYLVRVGGAGEALEMVLAIQRLNTLSQVEYAQPEYLWYPDEFLAYAEPQDAGDYASPWQIRSSAADGVNWGLEAIGAPLAWGCETGDRGVYGQGPQMAVVDVGFHDREDLHQNIVQAGQLGIYEGGWYTGFQVYHGTAVASVLGARGNNGRDMAGVMWGPSLSLYDATVFENGSKSTRATWTIFWRRPAPMLALIKHRLVEGIHDGADVVNLSMGVGLSDARLAARRFHITPTEAVEIEARDLARIVTAQPTQPLIVIAAGNNRYDAFWGVTPALESKLPDQVIVVSGVSSIGPGTAQLYKNSNHNSTSDQVPYNLVEIAAPAAGVGALKDEGGVEAVTGTSFAAPLVAGTAGLLKAFDPRLTSKDLKRLLIDGARAAGHEVQGSMEGSLFVVNAYESLKLAAQRPGAPLCGNAVWSLGKKVYIRRQDATGTTVLDSVVAPDFVTRVDALHGGHDLRLRLNLKTQVGYELRDGSWVRQPSMDGTWAESVSGSSGSYMGWGDYYTGKLARSHDRDTTVGVTRATVNGGPGWRYVFRAGGQALAEVGLNDPESGLTANTCYYRVYDDDPSDPIETCRVATLAPGQYLTTDWSYAYLSAGTRRSPEARLLVMRVDVDHARVFGQWYEEGCPRAGPLGDPRSIRMECRQYSTYSRSLGTEYYLFDASGVEVDRWYDPSGQVKHWGAGEDGSSQIAQIWRQNRYTVFGLAPRGDYDVKQVELGTFGTASCAMEERTLDPDHRLLWPAAECPQTFSGGISPSRLPEEGLRIGGLLPAGADVVPDGRAMGLLDRVLAWWRA
jgi:subtilisin family serine protease